MWSDEAIQDAARLMRQHRLKCFATTSRTPLENIRMGRVDNRVADDAAFQHMTDEGHYDHSQEEYRFIEVHGRKWF